MAVIAWFAIVFAATHPRGLWDFGAFYLRWRARSVPYLMLLRDEYPPFEDGVYPTIFEVNCPPATAIACRSGCGSSMQSRT
jgi:uncharacterized protein DUF4389